MTKLIAIAKFDMELAPHTWTMGLDYEAIDKGDYLTLASNEGQTNFAGDARKHLTEVFDFEDDFGKVVANP